MKTPRILYAGDSPAGGPANYLLALLNSIKANVCHIPPGKTIQVRDVKKSFDAFILSDYSKKDLALDAEKEIANQVQLGSGLLMVGGWGSFSGPFGKWKGSLIEQLLPVNCLTGDDRVNFPGGAIVHEMKRHTMFSNLTFKTPPVICGLNQVQPKPNSQTVLVVRELDTDHLKLKKEYPLLIVNESGQKRSAALTTDLAPHWCGGWVDWGAKRKVLAVNSKIQVEVGDRYVEFVTSLLRWLSKA